MIERKIVRMYFPVARAVARKNSLPGNSEEEEYHLCEEELRCPGRATILTMNEEPEEPEVEFPWQR